MFAQRNPVDVEHEGVPACDRAAQHISNGAGAWRRSKPSNGPSISTRMRRDQSKCEQQAIKNRRAGPIRDAR